MQKLILSLFLFPLLVSPAHADEDLVRVYFERGTACLREGRYSEAIENYTKVIELETSNIEAYYNRGLANQKLRSFDQAIEDFTRIIELRPDFTQAYFERGNTYFDRNQYEEAIKNYSKILELEPSNAGAMYNRGLANQKLRSFDQAIEDFTRIIELRPDFTQAYFERGNTYFDKDMDSHAIEDYTKALELNPGQEKAIYNRGLAYKRAKRYDTAHQDFEKVCALGDQAACKTAKELLAVIASESPAPVSQDIEKPPSSIPKDVSAHTETSKGEEVSEKTAAPRVPECSEGFLDLGDGTVKDCRTGLIWIKDLTSPGGIKNWHEAVAHSRTVKGTYCGTFRLPTRDELETFSKHLSLSENQPFANLRNGFYWTGEDYDAHHAWILYLFPCSNERWNTKENTFCNVLPVCSPNGN